MNYNTMQYNNIPYTQSRGGFTCKYFNFYPYHIMSFSTDTEQEMQNRIDDLVDNRASYEYKYKLSKQAASDFYKTLTYKGD